MKALTALPLSLMMAVAMLSGCSSTLEYGQATRLQNKTDSQQPQQDLTSIAAELTQQMLSSSSVKAIARGNQPLLAVLPVDNQTGEKLETQAIGDQIYGKLALNGQFALVSREKVSKEPSINSDRLKNRLTTIGEQSGARLILQPVVNRVILLTATQKAVYYELSLRLYNTYNTKPIWQSEQRLLSHHTEIIYGI